MKLSAAARTGYALFVGRVRRRFWRFRGPLGDFLDRARKLGIIPRGQLCRIVVHRNVRLDPVSSANHCPFGSYIRNVGTVTLPPSASEGAPLMPMSPPQVRVPMRGPRPASRK